MSENKKMFCNYCGKEIDVHSNFCSNCGKKIGNNNSNNRKEIYEGDVHKCPNCGEKIKSFTSVCPICGYELRNIKNTSAIIELAKKLEEIEAQKKNFFLKVFSSDAINDEKISVIRNFPIPNTKEDLYEFLILAKTNMNVEICDYKNKDYELALANAWKVKFEQAYLKSKIIFKDDERLNEIEIIYNENRNDRKNKKDKNARNVEFYNEKFGIIIRKE